MQSEFRMITDLATVAPKELLFNYDELKAFLTESLRDYKALVVTEDGVSDAKAKRAKLNKLAENINAYRINVKKQLMSKYDEDFKPKCDELVAMTKEASDNLDRQIKAFEQTEADEKVAQIKAFYDDLADDEVMEYLPWGRVNNPKWRNKGYSVENAQADIQTQIGNVRDDLSAIRGMGDDDTAYLLDVYRETLDLSAVVRKASEVKATRQREELRTREEEAQRRQMEAARKAVREMTDVPQNDELVTVDFRVWCTRTQLTALGEYMKRNGIKYGRCE